MLHALHKLFKTFAKEEKDLNLYCILLNKISSSCQGTSPHSHAWLPWWPMEIWINICADYKYCLNKYFLSHSQSDDTFISSFALKNYFKITSCALFALLLHYRKLHLPSSVASINQQVVCTVRHQSRTWYPKEIPFQLLRHIPSPRSISSTHSNIYSTWLFAPAALTESRSGWEWQLNA